MSIPDGSQSTVPVVGRLNARDAQLLCTESGGLVRSSSEYNAVLQSEGKAKPYLCPSLRDRGNYVEFITSLVKADMVTLGRTRRAGVTPFFVEEE